MLFNILLVVQIVVALGIIVFVMLQHGKGADAGPALSGGSQSLFGSSGGANAMSRVTAFLAVLFIANSLALTAITGKESRSIDSVLTNTLTEETSPQTEIPKPE